MLNYATNIRIDIVWMRRTNAFYDMSICAQ